MSTPLSIVKPSLLLGAALLAACGGGGGAEPSPPPASEARRASGDTLVAAGCNGGSPSGVVYANAEVEPFAAVHPSNGSHLLATWQQDRWSNGGARALVSALSSDGGVSWQRQLQPMSRCGGAAAGSAGDHERTTDPWVDFGPDGTAHLMGLAFSGTSFQPGARNAMLASRSVDGGRNWSAPVALITDGSDFFNDKNTLTADSTDATKVYAVWDRLDPSGHGPAMLARSVDAGLSWEPARAFVVPASAGISQTVGNRIVVLPGGPEPGALVNVYTQIDTVAGVSAAHVAVVRSTDQGLNWSAPVFVADLRAVGTSDAATGQRIRDGSILASIAAGPDGGLWLAWQDARFSGGLHDAIALSRSIDGGRSWSAPLAINRVASAPAFTPAVAVRSDGVVGVLHYDLRSNTADTSTLLADAWLLTSRDGVQWSEARVAGPFDMAAAPDAGGLFLGDYQALLGTGGGFTPVLVLAGADRANRTDVFSPRIDVTAGDRESPLARHTVRAAPTQPIAAADASRWRQARSAAIGAAMQARLPGWRARVQAGQR